MKKPLNYFKSIINTLVGKLFFLNTNSSHRKLKILIILPYAPYPVYTGGASRIFEKIKYFGSRHDLMVASFYTSKRIRRELSKIIKPYCKKLILIKREKPLMDFHTRLPYKVERVTTVKMWKALKKLDNNFDIAMFEHIHTAMYRELFNSCYTVLEEHNIESRILQQYGYNKINEASGHVTGNELDSKQADMLKVFETQHWPLFNLRTTVSEIDRNLMQSCCKAEILVVKNGIDTNNIQPVEYQEDGKILYMGNMSYRPNIEGIIYFIDVIFPVLNKKEPGLTLCIAGAKIPSQILELSESLNIECIENPPDMSEVASKCSVSIVPLLMGSGTRIKILHSMAMGIPVVSTTLGCEGLFVTDGVHLLVRDDPEYFSEGILKLRSDRELRNRLRINGRRLVKHEYNMHKILTQYESELIKRVRSHHSVLKYDHFSQT